MKARKIIYSLLLISTLLGCFTLPRHIQALDTLPPVPVSDAALRTKEVGITIAGYTIPGFTLDSVLIVVAKIALEKITDSTVAWINNGFDGNPAYLRNPKQYFTGLADGIVGSFIAGTDLDFLCSPFKDLIKVSLVASSYSQETPFQCTLSEVVGNIDSFYDDFSQGGWDAWFSMTQTPTNNPYGAYLEAKIELDGRLSEALGLKKDELAQGKGLLSYKTCSGDKLPPEYSGPEFNDGCLGEWETGTPGTFLESQMTNVLGTGVRQLELADEFDEIVGALVQQLLTKTIFGIKGLFGSEKVSGGARSSRLDIDGDGVADGNDVDGDGELDICYFGGVSSPEGPPCRGSSDTSTPPYIPPPGGICEVPTGNQYAGALMAAMNTVIANNPSVANLPNIETADGKKPNGKTFLTLVAAQLVSDGYNATADVLNGNNNPSTGDAIAVWLSGDEKMERYDALKGSDGSDTIAESIMTDFTGFIPLDCTVTGGSNDCGCQDDPTTPPIIPPGIPPNPGGTPGGPVITSVNPNSVTPGTTTVTITGTNLTTTVQFFDYRGDPAGRSTVTGTLNAGATQVTVLVPTGLQPGAGSVRVYRSATSYSNTLPITISGNAPGINLNVATPTKVVVPTGIEMIGYLGRTYNNGWWPSLSPDGRYVAFGNWGDSYVLDLTSTSTTPAWNFKKPPGFPTPEEGGGRCIAGQWLSNTKLSFVCEIGDVDNGSVSFWRYEVTVGEWIPVKTSDNPSYVVATIFRAKDNHWATYQAGPSFRIIKDNQVLATNAGGALSISGNSLVHACNNTNSSICVRDGAILTKTYPVRTPMAMTATQGGYILYGGYGPVHGITPTGVDTDHTISPSRTENPSEVFLVNGARWVSTLTWNPPLTKEYILLRPWGSRSAIVLDAPAVHASVVQKGSDLIVAYNDDQGNIKILTVPISAPRHQF